MADTRDEVKLKHELMTASESGWGESEHRMLPGTDPM